MTTKSEFIINAVTAIVNIFCYFNKFLKSKIRMMKIGVLKITNIMNFGKLKTSLVEISTTTVTKKSAQRIN